MIGFKTIEEFTFDECEAYLERTDVSEADRQRALNQRKYLIGQMPPISKTPPTPQTIIEKFPEYGFKPTSLLPGPATKGKSYARVPILIGYFLLLTGLVCLGLAKYYSIKADQYDHNSPTYWHYDDLELTMFLIGSYSPMVGIIVLSIAYSCRRKKPIKAVADYVSTTGKGINEGRSIFVKDRKFGVLKSRSAKVIVPAEYDKLTWATGKFLFGEINGKTLLVDTKGNHCTKPYDRLSWSEHEGILWAEQGGRRFLIDMYDNELS